MASASNEFEDDPDLATDLSEEECIELLRSFSEITDTNEGLAMAFLQPNRWDLDAALRAYFDSNCGLTPDNLEVSETEIRDNASDVIASSDKSNVKNKDGEENTEKTTQKEWCKIANSSVYVERALFEDFAASNPTISKTNDVTPSKCPPNVSPKMLYTMNSIRVLSWNLDGITSKSLKRRTLAVVDVVIKNKAEIIFFQEVVKQNEALLRTHLEESYHFFSSSTSSPSQLGASDATKKQQECPSSNYYMLVLIRRTNAMEFDPASFHIQKLPETTMNRVLVELGPVKIRHTPRANASPLHLYLLTTHLDSAPKNSAVRIAQISEIFEKSLTRSGDPRSLKCQSAVAKTPHRERLTTLFAGDLNLRHSEFSAAIEELSTTAQQHICDVWEATGKRREARDTINTRNQIFDEQQIDFYDRAYYSRHKAAIKQACQFDRMYLLGNSAFSHNTDYSKVDGDDDNDNDETEKDKVASSFEKDPEKCSNYEEKSDESKGRLSPVFFELVGLEKVANMCNTFPSDHWGILGHFNIEPV